MSSFSYNKKGFFLTGIIILGIAGCYFVYESVFKQLINNLVFKNNWNTYYQNELKTIQNLSSENVGGLIALGDKAGLEKIVGQENISNFKNFKCFIITDDKGKTLYKTIPSQNCIPEGTKVTDNISGIHTNIWELPGNEMMITFSSSVSYTGDAVGKIYLTLSASPQYSFVTAYRIYFIGCLILIVAAALLSLITTRRVETEEPVKPKPTFEPVTYKRPICKLGNSVVFFFEYIILGLIMQRAGRSSEIQQEAIMPNIGGYILEKKIGCGRISELFLAKSAQEDVTNKFAVKKILLENKDIIESLMNETERVALLDHPNIVKIITTRKKEQSVITEYVNGLSLARIMSEVGGKCPVGQSLFIVSQLCTGLKYAHSYHTQLSVVHQNLHPNNILISYEGDVKISDFGMSGISAEKRFLQKNQISYRSLENLVSQAADNQNSEGATVMGTPTKIMENLSKAQQENIYALGVNLYEMLSEKRLNESSSFSDIEDIPPELNQIVRKCLDDGYKDTNELLRDLIFLNPQLSLTYDMSNFSYLSPEQIAGQPVDRQTDIYALGVILYEMLSGKKIYRISDMLGRIKSLSDGIDKSCYLITNPDDNLIPLNELVKDIPKELNDIVMKCLAKDKKSRFGNINEIIERLNAVKISYNKTDLKTFMTRFVR